MAARLAGVDAWRPTLAGGASARLCMDATEKASKARMNFIGGWPGREDPPLATMPVSWFAHPSLELVPDEPLPLLVLDPPCTFRTGAIESLDREGRAWRIALSSSSVSALWAAAEAGLGVVPRTALHVPAGLKPAREAWGLPALPSTGIHLLDRGVGTPEAVDYLARVIREVVEDVVRA